MRLRPTHTTSLIPAQKPFLYSELPASLGRQLREDADAIRRLVTSTTASVIQIGLRLQIVRRSLGRLRFQAWLKAEFQWTQPVASNYMRAADAFCDVSCLDRLQPSALYVLARRKAAGAARAEALARAQAGELITKSSAELIVLKHNGLAPRPMQNTVSRLLRLAVTVGRDVSALSDNEKNQLARKLARLLELLRPNPPGQP